MMYRKICFNTIQLTNQQDQILRLIIENEEHLLTDKIVAMDVEYGGGRTVPRVAITDFNENVLYYSDFCLRYEDWIETKLTENSSNDLFGNSKWQGSGVFEQPDDGMYFQNIDQKLDSTSDEK